MACCIIAAFLFAQFMAMVRRWGVFWGVLPVPEGEVADTVFTRAGDWLRQPAVRGALAAALVIELGAGGGWLYVAHGAHIAEEADIVWSGLRGEQVIYAEVCSGTGYDDRARLVLNAPPLAARASSAI